MTNDTIVAPATAPGESAVAITRLSGPRALEIAAARFAGRASPLDSPSHRILFGSFLSRDGSPLDTVLLFIFRAPHSYTGEDLVEISSHGGAVLPAAILAELVASGARPARPGEFTERAFRNGKMDLAQAESVAALVRARSERSALVAREALGGSLTRRVAALDAELVQLVAEVESRIDFPADVGEPLDGMALASRCSDVAVSLREWIARLRESRGVEAGVRAALIGRPNVGKSSLLNALLGYERAIVAETPGTTRDTVEESIQVDGVEVRLADTAGVRHASERVEQLGVDRSRAAAESCDLAVLVLDRSEPVGDGDMEAAAIVAERPTIVAWNKADLAGGAGIASGREEARRAWAGGAGAGAGSGPGGSARIVAEVETVAVRPGGAESLRDAIREALPMVLARRPGDELGVTSSRQMDLLQSALASIVRAEEGLRGDESY
ncbi:MAG TPA: tRNA uridine-5-carboxymethylaminomethyl(34) synthesis GTPase MnmE, partial [Candidatus Eisenbacteria bacterium]|nr:tRNA uridine-5-carboxymethylaminomethyl(34) synthesis GTPase MnmE [Candidatus Eisenbacteria bacterium]